MAWLSALAGQQNARGAFYKESKCFKNPQPRPQLVGVGGGGEGGGLM